MTLLEDEMKNQWRDVFVTYIYGTTNTGKTRSVMEQFGYENVYRMHRREIEREKEREKYLEEYDPLY